MTAQLRRAAERTMLDRCTITRDPTGPESAPFNEATLTYASSPAATVVCAGRCTVTPDTDTNATSKPEGGQDIWSDEYRARIPIGFATPHIGDWLTVTHVAPGGDRELIGRDYQIVKVIARSRAVTRQLRMIDRTRGPRP